MRNKYKLKKLTDDLVNCESQRKIHYSKNLTIKYLCPHVGKLFFYQFNKLV